MIFRRVLLIAALLIALQPAPTPVRAQTTETMRVTFYTLRGVMYSGYYTHMGAAACSWRFPIGTRIVMSDGFVVTCLDRGMGDNYWPGYWVDIWAPSYWWGLRYVEGDYGLYDEVTVLW